MLTGRQVVSSIVGPNPQRGEAWLSSHLPVNLLENEGKANGLGVKPGLYQRSPGLNSETLFPHP